MKTNMPTKPKQPKMPKARVMFVADLSRNDVLVCTDRSKHNSHPDTCVPVLVLPWSDSDQEAAVERMAKEICYTSAIESGERPEFARSITRENWRNSIPDARAALRALKGGKS